MKQTIRICLLMALVGWTMAFVPTVVDSSSTRSTAASLLFLHPKQAAELEACAYECYCLESSKVASDRRRQDRRTTTAIMTQPPPPSVRHQRRSHTAKTGPVAWCRRVISGSTTHRRRQG